MLKSQQKVDIWKLSKICQSHQKLSEWQKVASRFTEIVYKSSSSRLSKMSLRELFVDLLDFLKQGTTSNWILMTQMLPPVNCAWLCWLYWCSGNYTVKHKRLLLSGWTVRQWTCIRTQFCLFKQHWRRNYRTVYPNAHKVCLWFFWFSQLLLKTL